MEILFIPKKPTFVSTPYRFGWATLVVYLYEAVLWRHGSSGARRTLFDEKRIIVTSFFVL